MPSMSKMVMMLIISFCAVSDKRSTTPLSRNRFPRKSIPTRGALLGMIKMMRIEA